MKVNESGDEVKRTEYETNINRDHWLGRYLSLSWVDLTDADTRCQMME